MPALIFFLFIFFFFPQSVDRRIFIYVESDGHVHQVNENSPGSSTWSGWTYNVFGDRRVLSKVTVEANTFTGYLEAFAILGIPFFSFWCAHK